MGHHGTSLTGTQSRVRASVSIPQRHFLDKSSKNDLGKLQQDHEFKVIISIFCFAVNASNFFDQIFFGGRVVILGFELRTYWQAGMLPFEPHCHPLHRFQLPISPIALHLTNSVYASLLVFLSYGKIWCNSERSQSSFSVSYSQVCLQLPFIDYLVCVQSKETVMNSLIYIRLYI